MYNNHSMNSSTNLIIHGMLSKFFYIHIKVWSNNVYGNKYCFLDYERYIQKKCEDKCNW